MEKKVMYIALLCLGILSLTYFLMIAFFTGHGTNFYFIWLFIGVGAIIGSVMLKRGIWTSFVPVWIRRLSVIVLCVCGLIFLIVEGCILSGFMQSGKEGLDYVVVLGAQMKATGPSKVLQYRLDKAYDYMEKNPETIAIVSGAQGPDEHISEARGMQDYLVQKGIAKDRILLEDKSENTFQNLTYSAALIDNKQATVGIITNDFHIFRALCIARRAGYKEVCGIAAAGEPALQLNNMMREFFGVIKDFAVGNL